MGFSFNLIYCWAISMMIKNCKIIKMSEQFKIEIRWEWTIKNRGYRNQYTKLLFWMWYRYYYYISNYLQSLHVIKRFHSMNYFAHTAIIDFHFTLLQSQFSPYFCDSPLSWMANRGKHSSTVCSMLFLCQLHIHLLIWK